MKDIDSKIREIEVIRKEIENFEVNPDDYEQDFDESLDRDYGEFMSYSASYILKQIDPIAYRCGLLDYVDGLDVTPPDEWDTELSELLQELDYLIDDKIEELNSLIKDWEQELEYLEDGDYREELEQNIRNAQDGLKELEEIRKEHL